MARPRLAGGVSVAFFPSIRIFPEVTSSSPAMRRGSVDLPQARGACEDNELPVLDREVERRNDLSVAETLGPLGECDASHDDVPT